MNVYIHTRELRNLLKRAARSLLLAYGLLYLLTMWEAENLYQSRIDFFRECEAAGGFVTGTQSCTRVRVNHGMFQL